MPRVLGKDARMKVVYLLRKPLSEGTITANVLKHGTGALNIDASRVPTNDNLNGGAYSSNASERHDGDESWRFKNGGRKKLPGDERDNKSSGILGEGSTSEFEYKQPSGRWPANVILQHLEGCTDSACVKECPASSLGKSSKFYTRIGGKSNG